MTTKQMDDWYEFRNHVVARLAKGAAEYGDASFAKPPGELRREIAEELFDVAAWAFILWTRVRALELPAAHEPRPCPTGPTCRYCGTEISGPDPALPIVPRR